MCNLYSQREPGWILIFVFLCWFWFILQDYASWCCTESQKNARYYHCLLRWLAWMMTSIMSFSVSYFLLISGCCLFYFYQSNVPRGLVILLVDAGGSFVDLFSHDLYYLSSKYLETSMVATGFVLEALDQGCKESTTTFMSCLWFPHLVCCTVYSVDQFAIAPACCYSSNLLEVHRTSYGSTCLLGNIYPSVYLYSVAIARRLIYYLLPRADFRRSTLMHIYTYSRVHI